MTAGTDFGAPPPVSSTSYIGVPNGFAYLPQQNRGGFNIFGALGIPSFGDQSGSVNGAPVAPRYQSGDEFNIASMPPEQLARLQQQLASAGLVGSNTKIRVGIADDATVAAFKSLLGFANVNGLDWQSALSKLMANPPVDTSSSASQLPNPAEEDEALYSSAKSLLGHDPRPDQLNAFRPYYEAKLKADSSQQLPQLPDYSTSAPGSTVSAPPLSYAPPSLSTAADQFLRQTDSAGIAQQDLATKYQSLLSIIGGPG